MGISLLRLIGFERADAACAQVSISDRPAFLSHPVGAKAAVGGDKMIVLLAFADVLRRRLRHFECGCGLVGTGAACTETAVKAIKPASIGMISRILASVVGGQRGSL